MVGQGAVVKIEFRLRGSRSCCAVRPESAGHLVWVIQVMLPTRARRRDANSFFRGGRRLRERDHFRRRLRLLLKGQSRGAGFLADAEVLHAILQVPPEMIRKGRGTRNRFRPFTLSTETGKAGCGIPGIGAHKNRSGIRVGSAGHQRPAAFLAAGLPIPIELPA